MAVVLAERKEMPLKRVIRQFNMWLSRDGGEKKREMYYSGMHACFTGSHLKKTEVFFSRLFLLR